MWRGLYTAGAGMITETKRTDVIANNLANAATTGYKRDKAIHREFEAMLIRRFYDHEDGGMVGMNSDINTNASLNTSSLDVTQFKGFSADPFYRPSIGLLGLGDYIDEVAVDWGQGPIETTGNEFDLAIGGEGFFTIQSPDGIRYTRNGAFFRNAQGYIQDIRGYNLLDEAGQPIQIPRDMFNREVIISEDGGIYIRGEGTEPYAEDPNQIVTNGNAGNRQLLARIQVVNFEDRMALGKQGDNLYYAKTDAEGNLAQPVANNEAVVLQGALEKSNVQIVREMVELIHNHRMYEAGAKAVTTQDSMLDKSVNDVGAVS
ncbi:MAG: flagellar hook-basal body protein [Selenomonadaceae bacterium]|nr:flagellar hook-basal body protein [Selenomonadaceae bacterium]